MTTTIIAMNENGVALLARGQVNDAEKVFSNCIQLSPGFLPAFFNRGAARLSQGLCTEALSDIEHYITHSGDINGYAIKGDIAMAMRDYTEAERCFSRCLQETPLPALYFKRFVARCSAGDFRAGWEDLKTAAKLKSPEALEVIAKMRRDGINV